MSSILILLSVLSVPQTHTTPAFLDFKVSIYGETYENPLIIYFLRCDNYRTYAMRNELRDYEPCLF